MDFAPFITRILDFWGFSFILAHFRATAALYKAILEAGVEIVIKLTSTVNHRALALIFLLIESTMVILLG